MSEKSKAPPWGLKLRAHMNANGPTLEVLAGKMDMTPGGIRHWLNGTRKPKLEEAIDLIYAAGADPAVILNLRSDAAAKLAKVHEIIAAPSSEESPRPPSRPPLLESGRGHARKKRKPSGKP